MKTIWIFGAALFVGLAGATHAMTTADEVRKDCQPMTGPTWQCHSNPCDESDWDIRISWGPFYVCVEAGFKCDAPPYFVECLDD